MVIGQPTKLCIASRPSLPKFITTASHLPYFVCWYTGKQIVPLQKYLLQFQLSCNLHHVNGDFKIIYLKPTPGRDKVPRIYTSHKNDLESYHGCSQSDAPRKQEYYLSVLQQHLKVQHETSTQALHFSGIQSEVFPRHNHNSRRRQGMPFHCLFKSFPTPLCNQIKILS